MKLVYSELQNHILIDEGIFNCLVVENQVFYHKLVKDLKLQTEGFEGFWVLSENDKPLAIHKRLELLIDFIDFDVNKKSLLTRIIADLEQKATTPDNMDKSMQLLANIEKYLFELSEDYDFEIQCEKITIGQIFKASGMSVIVDKTKLVEILYSYMQLIRDFDEDKLFVFVNLRCFISDEDAEDFVNTAVSHGYKMLFLESKEYKLLSNEKRLVIDNDLCEI